MKEITLSTKKLVKKAVTICILIEILIFSMDLVFNYLEFIPDRSLRKLFNITREDGLGNLFSTLQTFTVALFLWAIYFFETHLKKPTKIIAGWLTSALFFTWMAVDDGAEVHEKLGSALDNLFIHPRLPMPQPVVKPGFIEALYDLFPSYSWQFIFLPIFGLVALYLFFFWMKNLTTNKQKWLVFFALGLFVISVGLDFVEGLDDDHFLNFYHYLAVHLSGMVKEPDYLVSHFGKAIEETLEMLANTLFLCVFFSYMLNLISKFEFQNEK